MTFYYCFIVTVALLCVISECARLVKNCKIILYHTLNVIANRVIVLLMLVIFLL